jgi:UDP-glucose 4-epimerase
VEWIAADSRDWPQVLRAVSGNESIIHLAAGSSFLMYEEEPVARTSDAIIGFQHILEAARRSNVGKVVYASTSAVYEGNNVPYVENMTLEPPDLKAFAKKTNEEMAHLYSRRFGIPIIGLRPFSVYGVGEASKGPYANVVSLFAWTMLTGQRPIVWGNGEQMRDFIYVDDVVEAFVRALDADIPTQEINVGTGVETSFNDVIGIINECLGTCLAPIYLDVPVDIYAQRLLADPSLAARVLNFRSSVSVREGVQRVLDAARPLIDGPQSTLAQMHERAQELAMATSAMPLTR